MNDFKKAQQRGMKEEQDKLDVYRSTFKAYLGAIDQLFSECRRLIVPAEGSGIDFDNADCDTLKLHYARSEEAYRCICALMENISEQAKNAGDIAHLARRSCSVLGVHYHGNEIQRAKG